MDSKYASIEKNGTSSTAQPPATLLSNGFQLKRGGMVLNGVDGNSKKIKQTESKDSGISNNSDSSSGPVMNGGNCDMPVNRHSGTQNRTILEQRKSLPVYMIRTRITQEIINNSTLIIIGETGSGKTTQVPQFLHEYGMSSVGGIAVTQPRRVAAITIAKRVAQEIGCRLGDVVGYSVRFEDMTTSQTKIKYMTDGTLLREALSDRLLKAYRYIILDEAHERTINTDVLFGIVKEAQRLRAEQKIVPLKIILMSATMDVDHFSEYFNNCNVIYLEGRAFSVHVMQSKHTQSDYLVASLSTLFEIHTTAPPNHDVLIFLTGQEEIESMVTNIRSIAKSNHNTGPPLRVFPLYAQLPQHKQLEVFLPVAVGARKVILATNIAETSLTISGIRYVIDCGMVKRRIHDAISGIDTLKVERISQAQAWQRTGRAGRESEGYCYRTYTLAEYNAMQANTTPEILRSNITATVLQLLALGIDVHKFDFMDVPSKNSIEFAMKTLFHLGAITGPKSLELTTAGRKMSRFPLDPRYSKMLLAAATTFKCLEEILSIVAVLSSENIFVVPNERRELALNAHAKFESKHGDHLTILNVFNAFQRTEKMKMWCQDNFLNLRNLSYASDIRSQLVEICERCDLDMSSCGANFDLIRKCMISGLFNNVAELQQRENIYMTVVSRQRGKIHPSSVLQGKARPKCIIFTELVATGKNYFRTVTTIDPEWVEEVVPNSGLARQMLSLREDN